MSRTIMDCEACGSSYQVVDGSTMGVCGPCAETSRGFVPVDPLPPPTREEFDAIAAKFDSLLGMVRQLHLDSRHHNEPSSRCIHCLEMDRVEFGD